MAKQDLQFWIDALREQHGFRLDAIFPADAPRCAELSLDGVTLRVEVPPSAVGEAAAHDGVWQTGRAGMEYRDLLPSRRGGAVIASHIRIRNGGLVPDYVHYHEVEFQMIYCKSGWVKVVYEDQGDPFILQAGDCVLQPPTIRHRVLECSDGLEVVEVGCPAEHRTLVDHELELPNSTCNPNRLFAGQRFVRHQVAQALWEPWTVDGFEARDLGLGKATDGLVEVKVVRASAAKQGIPVPAPNSDSIFAFPLEHGELLMVKLPPAPDQIRAS